MKHAGIGLAAAAVLGLAGAAWWLAAANPASASPPQSVSYYGAPVETATVGKAFTMNFQVKNTGDDSYTGIKVIYHIPSGLKVSSVSPSDGDIQNDLVTWSGVSLKVNEIFYPSLTATLASSTPAGKEFNIWVEVTRDGMDKTSKTFTVTAKAAAVKKVVAALTAAQVKALFIEVYGRTPTAKELTYWLGRRADKTTSALLKGTMQYHKARNIKH